MPFVKSPQIMNQCKIKAALHLQPIIHHSVGAATYAQSRLKLLIFPEIN
jgi:hypothetical protein